MEHDDPKGTFRKEVERRWRASYGHIRRVCSASVIYQIAEQARLIHPVLMGQVIHSIASTSGEVPWEAIATVCTGLFAVVGATFVGLKQASITKKQVEILARQNDLERNKLTYDLYERRYAAFDAVAALLADAVTGAIDRADIGISNRFLVAMTEAVFLFPPQVSEGMREAWDKVEALHALNRKMAAYHRDHEQYEAGDPERAHDIELWIDQRIRSLADLFPQLKIGHLDIPENDPSEKLAIR